MYKTNIISIKKLNLFGEGFQQTIGIPMGTNCAPPIYFYMHIRQISFKGFSRNKLDNYPRPLIPASVM